MPISVHEIADDQLKRIFNLEEGHFTDVKAIEISPAKLTKSISAFANTDGGELYIGIDENKELNIWTWRGFTNQEGANGHIQAFEEIFPLGDYCNYTFLSNASASGLILHVEIRKTPDIKYASNSTPYMRRGAQNLPVDDAEKLRRLELNKGIATYETQTVACDLSLVTNSSHIIRFVLEVVPTAEPEAWLRKQNLIIDDKPTVAGLLLFAEEPQAMLPKSAIKVYRYRTSEEEGTRATLAFDPITIEGNLYDQISAAVKKTVELVEGIPLLGKSGLEEIRYPQVALHEIITNAVLHRDYSFTDDVHIRIYDNRIEIENPGKLPGHVTVDNILDTRVARNPGILRLINKFPNPPNKDVGEGLRTAFEAIRQLRLKDPIIEEMMDAVRVTIRHEKLASNEELIMDYLGNHDEINNRTARAICHVGDANDMKRIFQRMIQSNLIERITEPGYGGGFAAYRKASKAENDTN